MTNTCVTLLKPVDEKRVRTLAKLAATAESQGVNILLLGAFARDLLFWHVHGIECHRETMDVDLVAQLKDWAAYHKYRRALLDLGFKEDEAADHPEKITDPQTNVEVDLLPFGEIAADGKTVVWPEDDSRWSVIGIQDAYENALRLGINCEGVRYRIPFISVPSLVMLKIVAAQERPAARAKRDTVDIGFVIGKYLAIGNKVRLEAPPHGDILDAVDNDLDRATARLLGRDMGAIVSDSTRDHLAGLLRREVTSKSLCRFTRGLSSAVCKGNFSRARLIAGDLLDGLMWRIR